MGGLVALAGAVVVLTSAELALCAVMVLVGLSLVFAVAPTAHWTVFAILISVCLSVPISGALAAILIGRVAVPGQIDRFRKHLFILAAGIGLLATDMPRFVVDALRFAQKNSAPDAADTHFVVSLLGIGAASCTVAGLLALGITTLLFCVELPVQWLLQGKKFSGQAAHITKGLRPMLVVLIVSLAFSLIVDLFSAELWP